MQLLLDGVIGIYIPQAFAKGFNPNSWHVSEENMEILKQGPEHPEYWDAWDEVLYTAFYMDTKGRKWFLFQDGDLFAYLENEPLEEF